MRVKVTNIDWDIKGYEGKKPKLPKEVTVNIMRHRSDDFIINEVSNQVGWCINSCNFELITELPAAASRRAFRQH